MVETLNWSFEPASSPDPNSCGISYAVGDVVYDSVTPDNFPAGSFAKAIHDFLIGHGWSAWAPDTNKVAGKYYYRSLCLNGALYKWVMLDFVTTAGKLIIKVAESWNSAAAATNQAFIADAHITAVTTTTSSGNNKIATHAGKLWLGASARHILMLGYCNGVYGNNTSSAGYMTPDNGPVGVFEVTRQPYDTEAIGLPKFANWSTAGIDQQYTSGFWFPRTRGGTLSNSKTKAVYAFGGGGVGNEVATWSNHYPFGMPKYPSAVENKVFASNVLIFDSGLNTSTEIIGHAYNLIYLTKFTGSGIGDDIQVPVSADANFGNHKFYDPDGTLEPYWIVGSIGDANYAHRVAIPK